MDVSGIDLEGIVYGSEADIAKWNIRLDTERKLLLFDAKQESSLPVSTTEQTSPDTKTPTTPAAPAEQAVPIVEQPTSATIQPAAEKTTEQAAQKKVTNSSTNVNIKNKKTYKQSKKVKVSDADGIQSVKLNKKKISVKKGKKSFSFKLSSYKKYLVKKNKWNKLVITDLKGNKKTIKFKVK